MPLGRPRSHPSHRAAAARAARPLHSTFPMNHDDPTVKPNRMPSGKVGYALLWLLGIPIPILLGVFFLRGCN